jgi:hypothetical protein
VGQFGALSKRKRKVQLQKMFEGIHVGLEASTVAIVKMVAIWM